MSRHRFQGGTRAFTLFEVIMALMILGLLSGAVYSLTSAALESSKATIVEQAGVRRLEAFVSVLRSSLLNMSGDARIFLRMGKSSSGAPIPEFVFSETSGTFGVSSLAGGSLILAARPMSDGTRNFAILRVPARVQGLEYDRMMAEGPWISILPGVEKVVWSFRRQGNWQESWPDGAGRPEAIRLSFEYSNLPGTPLHLEFWIPTLAKPQSAPNPSPQKNPVPPPHRMSHRFRQRAIALPLVLWSIAFMGGVVALLAGIVGDWLDNESRAERGFIARQMALSGIALGLNPAIKPGDPLLTSGNIETEGYQVRLENEAARINPNFWVEQGTRPVFLKLFESWGADLQMGEAAIDSLLDWIDGDDLVNLKGAERGEYERTGRPGYPANRPLRHIREMEAVMNLSPILSQKENWQDYFTIWYRGKINIQHATPPILMELAGLTPAQVDALIRMRVGQDGIQGTADDQKLGSIEDVASFLGAGGRQRDALVNYFDTSGDVRRIESTGYCHGVKYKIVVVSDAGASGQIMSWEEK